ncbi:hypothetical protein ACFRI7_34805 [Streptomyces sp. NPDC056716]|uniref:hypothetical protein n=1 Tax=unclassified Streptomyces TaxID=2593676 RepID=UPI00367F7A90
MLPHIPVTPAAGHRLAAALGALLALLLAVLPTVTPIGPAPGPAPTATGAVHRTDSGQRADEPCGTGCAAQARGARYDHLGERPSPPDHQATTPRTTSAAQATGVHASARSAPLPLSPGPAAQHRGRAPPAPPGS